MINTKKEPLTPQARKEKTLNLREEPRATPDSLMVLVGSVIFIGSGTSTVETMLLRPANPFFGFSISSDIHITSIQKITAKPIDRYSLV